MGLDVDFKIKVFNSREVTQLYGLKVNEITLHLGSLGSHYMIKDWIQKHKDYEGDGHIGELILEEREVVNLYNDFSKFIIRRNSALIIRGRERELWSYKDGDLKYTEENRMYGRIPSYEVISILNLKKGDVFILDDIEEKNIEIEDFKIFMGEDYNKDIITQCLRSSPEFELIYPYFVATDKYVKVKRFLRE